MFSAEERDFLTAQRVAHLGTADAAGVPHVVPVCFALVGETAYITVDDKPKRTAQLKRLSNIAENPSVVLVADHYDDDDWSKLGWVMAHGRAEVLHEGPEHAEAQRLLRERYVQLRAMAIERHPVIAIRMERVVSWGRLSAVPAGG